MQQQYPQGMPGMQNPHPARGLSPGRRPVSPGGRPMSPGRRPMSPRGRPMSPGGRPMSPGRRPLSPRGRPGSPGWRPMSPGHRPTSPYHPMSPPRSPSPTSMYNTAGIGITFEPDQDDEKSTFGMHRITSIRQGSPAQTCGRILKGDILYAVNSNPQSPQSKLVVVQGMPLNQVISFLTGPPNTPVLLSILDGDFPYLPPKITQVMRTILPTGVRKTVTAKSPTSELENMGTMRTVNYQSYDRMPAMGVAH